MRNPELTAKKKFGILLKLTNKNKNSSIPPLVENDKIINNDQEKANIFNTFFASKATLNNSNEDPPLIEKIPDIPHLDTINTSPFEVSKFISILKKSAFSHCGISAQYLQIISSKVRKPISELFNNLFSVGLYPTDWKIAHVTPVYKRSGPKIAKESYRPISLLATLSKVCESILHDRLLAHLMDNNIITCKQAAYLRGDSTQSQLLYLVHTIRKAWGEKSVCQSVFLDISAAFDKVWHKGLLAKLEGIGVSGQFLLIIESYLSNRKQKVMIDGVPSVELSIDAGVPQGSRLGPLLFLVYINDIVNDLESDCLLFADDCCLISTASDPNISALQLNKDLEKIDQWATKWKVTFNASKSKDIIFSNKCLNNSPPLKFNSSLIERVSSHKHLGVYLTNNLDWSLHINETCNKALKKLAVLRSVKLLHRNTLDILYKLTVRSIIDYGLVIFGSTLKLSDLERLEKLQYCAAKICTGALHLTSRDKLNKEMGWGSIKTRIDFLGLSLFHKIHLGETRPLIKTYTTKYSVKPNSRQDGGYRLHKNYGVKFSNSFFHT